MVITLIDPDKIPEHEGNYLGRATLAAFRKVCDKPEYQEAYKKWKAERDKRKEEPHETN